MTERDKKWILWASPIVVVLVLLLVFHNETPAPRVAQVQRVNDALNDYLWLQSLSVSELATRGCPINKIDVNQLQALASPWALSDLVLQPSGDNLFLLSFGAEDGNRVLQLLRWFSCSDYEVVEATIDNVSEGSSVVKSHVTLRSVMPSS